MRVVLTIADGPYEGRTVLLQVGQTIKIGRTEWADFSLPHDERMSSVHFALDCERNRCAVRDLESTNGTTVNGEPVPEAELQDGDVIVAGRTRFTVAIEIAESILPVDQPVVEPDKTMETPASSKPLPASAAIGSTLSESLLLDRPTALDSVSDAPPVSRALLLASESKRPYAAALQDPDPDVQREALYAAAWSGEAWLLDYCRSLAREPAAESWDAMRLLAILGEPSDLNLILKIGRSVALGPDRFAIYASYGHPRTVRDLLMAIESKDAKTAVAAGAAFSKITAAEIDSDEQAELPPETSSEAEEAESEPEQAVLPSAKLAREHWSRVNDSFTAGTRWRGGLNLSDDNSAAESLGQLDMEARWELCLRMAHRGLPYKHLLPPTLG